MARPPYIAIAGNIGAGKSSFLDFLTHRYAIEPVFEPDAANPFLARYYGDMKRWAFHSQVWFLAKKLELHRQFEDHPLPIVQDRSVWEDAEVFAANTARARLMSADEYATYRTLFESAAGMLRAPDLLVYLRCPVRTLRKRIVSRGRPSEQAIPEAYLRGLHKLYESFYASYTHGPKLVFDTEHFDPVTDIIDLGRAIEVLEPWLKPWERTLG
jgi:deoxyadenosine/deoxycytidine kinase